MNGGEPIALVKSIGLKALFGVYVMLYLVAPIVIIPIWAYHEGNWWLLFGIIVACVIAPQLAQRKGHLFGGLLLLTSALFWYLMGIHSYYTFYSVCALWSYMFFQIADNSQAAFAMRSLVESPDIFAEAIAERRIRVIRKRETE